MDNIDRPLLLYHNLSVIHMIQYVCVLIQMLQDILDYCIHQMANSFPKMPLKYLIV